MHVLIVDADHDITQMEIHLLAQARPEWKVTLLPVDTEREELRRAIQDSDLLITEFINLDDFILKDPGKLQAVSVNAVGFETVDLDAAAAAGISVFALRDYCTDEVAEHTIALMMALERKLPWYDRTLADSNQWKFESHPRPRRVAGQTLGVIGFGKIGQGVARRALGLGMHVLVHSNHGLHRASLPENEWMRYLSFVSAEEIFEHADVISNHMAQTAENVHFFDEAAFSAMKRQPVFINTGRGAAVDTQALMRALQSGRIYGAGLDVLEHKEEAQEILKAAGDLNLIVTPHSAFYSETSCTRLAEDTCWNLINCTKNEPSKITRVLVWKGQRWV